MKNIKPKKEQEQYTQIETTAVLNEDWNPAYADPSSAAFAELAAKYE